VVTTTDRDEKAHIVLAREKTEVALTSHAGSLIQVVGGGGSGGGSVSVVVPKP
jgi:hypothetical protein